MLKNLNNFILN